MTVAADVTFCQVKLVAAEVKAQLHTAGVVLNCISRKK